MPKQPETLLCFAVKEEARFFQSTARAHPEVRVLVTGMGRKNAEESVRSALAIRMPRLVLTTGFAGGLRPGLERGTVIFSGAEATGLEAALTRAGARPGVFQPSDRVVTNPDEKRKLHEATGADAVEMESFAIGALCRESGVPCTTVRVVLDTADEELPLDFNRVLTPEQRIDAWKLGLALLSSPGKIPALLRLRHQGEGAARELARVLSAVIETDL